MPYGSVTWRGFRCIRRCALYDNCHTRGTAIDSGWGDAADGARGAPGPPGVATSRPCRCLQGSSLQPSPLLVAQNAAKGLSTSPESACEPIDLGRPDRQWVGTGSLAFAPDNPLPPISLPIRRKCHFAACRRCGQGAPDTKGFVKAYRQINVTLLSAQKINRNGGSASDGRLTRHVGYEVGRRKSKRTERCFIRARPSARLAR